MPRPGLAVLALALGLGGCVSSPVPAVPDAGEGPDPLGVVRVEPTTEVHDDEVPPFDPRRMERGLARRFPGVAAIDLVKVLVIPGGRSGLCATTVSPPWETGAEVIWSAAGRERRGSGIRELKERGWWPIYRSPQGQGFERRERLEALDLTVTTEIGCGCLSDTGTVKETRDLELRFRWAAGGMPEVSARTTDGGRTSSLSPTITFGHLVTYDFETTAPFPNGARGTCDARVLVSILADPPIL